MRAQRPHAIRLDTELAERQAAVSAAQQQMEINAALTAQAQAIKADTEQAQADLRARQDAAISAALSKGGADVEYGGPERWHSGSRTRQERRRPRARNKWR